MTVPARIYNRVLVPLDGSTAAEFAVRFGADLASKHDAELVLLHVRYLSAPVTAAEQAQSEGRTLEQAQEYLASLSKDLRGAGIRVQGRVVESHDLPGALLRFVESERISIIVMSTQGRTAMMHWLLGSNLERALNSLPVPILLVRPMYQKIIVPLDGSTWSETAIPRAVEIARVHDAEVVLLHVYQSKAGDYAGQWALAGQQEIADQTYEQMRDQLVALRNRLRAEGLSAREVLIRSTSPAQAICDFVNAEDGISLIVMSTHGRTGLARWLVGSVAQKVLKDARCPVTLVHPDK
jgi:nucleotide-binding universal stress UspA family protein